jgi:hypothetical protein
LRKPADHSAGFFFSCPVPDYRAGGTITFGAALAGGGEASFDATDGGPDGTGKVMVTSFCPLAGAVKLTVRDMPLPPIKVAVAL